MGDARKILLVGDDPAVRKTFEQAFAGKGNAVVAVSSGEEALWQLGRDRYDAVFAELVLRGMSGLEVAEEIHASQPRLPIVVIAGDDSAAARTRAAAAGAAEFLQMPVSPEGLADTVGRVVPAAASGAALQDQAVQSTGASAQASTEPRSRLRDIVLFLFAPLIALVYVVLFPIVGLGVLAYSAMQEKPQAPQAADATHAAAQAKSSILTAIATMLAMLVTGVVYGVLGPLLGIGLVLWFGLEAWGKLGAKAVGPGQT